MTGKRTAPNDRSVDEIDEKYREVDPDDVTEDAIDYFEGDPSTESGKRDED